MSGEFFPCYHHHVDAEGAGIEAAEDGGHEAADGIADGIEPRGVDVTQEEVALGLLGGDEAAGVGSSDGVEEGESAIDDLPVGQGFELHSEIFHLVIIGLEEDASLTLYDVVCPGGVVLPVAGLEKVAHAAPAAAPGGFQHAGVWQLGEG